MPMRPTSAFAMNGLQDHSRTGSTGIIYLFKLPTRIETNLLRLARTEIGKPSLAASSDPPQRSTLSFLGRATARGMAPVLPGM